MQLSYLPQSQAVPAAFNTVQYEGYGPGGTAVLIECSAPERHDLAAHLRRVFAAHGGHLGAQGSVSYLFIRTGGEHRISNFLLWNLAYTELYFTDCLWPDFDAGQLDAALVFFSARERRFGRTSEQARSPASA